MIAGTPSFWTSKIPKGSVPIPTLPSDVMRSLSSPLVSTVNVSLAGNLIAVLLSPIWNIESAIPTPLENVDIPPTFKPPDKS